MIRKGVTPQSLTDSPLPVKDRPQDGVLVLPPRKLKWRLMTQLLGLGHKDGLDYELTVTYTDDADLERTVYEIIGEVDNIADLRHCCTECNLWAVDDPDRQWG